MAPKDEIWWSWISNHPIFRPLLILPMSCFCFVLVLLVLWWLWFAIYNHSSKNTFLITITSSYLQSITGWWFGCHFLFSHSVGNLIIPIDELIVFRGVALAHQPVIFITVLIFGKSTDFPKISLRNLRTPTAVAPSRATWCSWRCQLRKNPQRCGSTPTKLGI